MFFLMFLSLQLSKIKFNSSAGTMLIKAAESLSAPLFCLEPEKSSSWAYSYHIHVWWSGALWEEDTRDLHPFLSAVWTHCCSVKKHLLLSLRSVFLCSWLECVITCDNVPLTQLRDECDLLVLVVGWSRTSTQSPNAVRCSLVFSSDLHRNLFLPWGAWITVEVGCVLLSFSSSN